MWLFVDIHVKVAVVNVLEVSASVDSGYEVETAKGVLVDAVNSVDFGESVDNKVDAIAVVSSSDAVW